MIQIIPAIDLSHGRCVRLLHGDFSTETVYSDRPDEVAAEFAAAGAVRLHMVDLDGARTGATQHLDVLRRVSAKTPLAIDYGGGIRSLDDVKAVFNAGASMATIGSLAIRSPEMLSQWAKEFGPERFLIGIDVRDGNAAIDGWMTNAAIGITAAMRELIGLDFSRFFVTDISKDGAMQGPAVGLYRELLTEFPGVSLIASGGVSSIADVVALESAGCEGVIVGRAIYEGSISLEEIGRHAR